MKLVIFASSRYMLPTIKLLKSNFDLTLVVTTEKKLTDAVPAFCNENNIPYLSVQTLKDPKTQTALREINAVLGVLGYFGLILPHEVLELFPKGIVNIHPSLLPKYRGPTPVQTAILNGDSETGTSIIILDNEVDHGPILTQQKEVVLPTDTTDSLHERLFSLGAKLLEEVLPKYLNSQISLKSQTHDNATFTKELSKIDGQIDIDNPPSKDKLDRMIRAYFPWPGVWTTISVKDKALRVKFLPSTSLRGKNETTDEAIPPTRHPERSEGSRKKNRDSSPAPQNDNGFFLQVEGGNPMSVKDFINGYPEMKEQIEGLFK